MTTVAALAEAVFAAARSMAAAPDDGAVDRAALAHEAAVRRLAGTPARTLTDLRAKAEAAQSDMNAQEGDFAPLLASVLRDVLHLVPAAA